MSLERELFSEIRGAGSGSRSVVLGFDGSDLARAALELAGRRAGAAGRVTAVYAAPWLPEPAVGVPAPIPPPSSPEEIGKRVLSDIPDQAASGARIDKEVRIGAAAPTLVEVARQEGADEIVVGSHGAGRLRALLGSTSHALVHSADRPVVVLTERAARSTPFTRGEPAHLIVLGYDGSEDAGAALEYALRHLAADGELVAVHAYRAPAEWTGTPHYNAALSERMGRGQRLLDSITHEPRITGELIADAPASALARLAASRDADEIVVGSRGLGVLRATLGSVAHALLHEADRPVVIVPRPENGG